MIEIFNTCCLSDIHDEEREGFMPKFSVIIPIYNVEKYLNQCIDSVLHQAYIDFELILVDDGSSDGCPGICDEYRKNDNRVKVIHKKNAGVSLARQDGIAIATGEYLVFIDADDRVTNDFFEVISRYTNVDIIRFGCIVERSDGSFFERLPREREGLYEKCDIENEIYSYLVQSESARYYCPNLWRHVFKRELFVSNMVKDKVIKIGEDGACVIPCIYHAQSLFCIHKCLYIYNYNETSATKGKQVYPWDGPALIADHLKERIDITMYDFQQQLDRKIVHELFGVVISRFNTSKNYKDTRLDIMNNLEKNVYSNAIKKAYFKKNIKAKLMLIVLKYKIIFLCRIYNKFR